jgi:hypothetical protein
MFYAYSPAAAAHANASTISINGLTLDGNSRYNNGGIYWRTGTALPTLNVSIKNCTVQNFGATGTPVAGGGLSIIGTGAYASFVVDSCLIENNTGSSGGGVNVEGEKTIRSSAILNNTATGSGGGIYIYTGTAATGAGLTITGCLIEGNTAAAANGGGIYVVDVGTKHNIHNCIVVNNSATTNGGGVYFGSTGTSIAKISNLTIANNRAGSGAGAYFAKAGVGVYNTIFYNNRDTLSALENITYGARYPAPFSNNIIDKKYSDLTMTSCIVSADSAAIFGENWATALTSIGMDKGTAAVGGNFTLPNVDYTGKARQVGAIDIGPYEIFHAPANLSGIPGGSVVGLTWSAVPGATSYNIYADAGSLEVATTLIATSTTPYYRATGLTPESPYTFTVKAPIEPALWATVQVTTLNASTPDSPDGLTVSAATESSVSLSWTLPANAAGISKYIVYANGVAVDSTADADVTSITVAGLLPWREYSFTVRSKSSANGVLSAPTNPSTTRTADNTAPSATVATLKSATKTTLTVEWSASVDAGALAGYIIYVDSSAVDTITLSSIDDDILSLMNGKFTYAITGRTASTEYSVGVRAYDEAGNFSEQAATNLSTTDADEPLIWYVGKWIGKPADYILPTVNAAYTEIAAVTGAQLWIQGEHNLSERITLSGKNVNSISLYGGFAGYENDPSERARAAGGKGWEFSYPTTLKIGSGSAIYSSVTNPPLGSIVIDGLRLEGVSAGNSRGIYWGSNSATDSVAIRNCVIQNFGGDSSTYNGGGIQLGGEAKHKSFVVEDCLIRNNKALNGGGIHMDGHRTIRNCEIRGNSVIGRSESVAPEDSAEAVAGAGGGVYVYKADGISSITGCLIEGNRAYSGGGLYLRHVSDSAAVGSNVVVNNTAVYGGGVAFSGDTTTSTTALKITNFTIASNRADQRGGGVYFADSGQQVYNTILWNNRTATASGDTTDNVYANPLANDLTFSHNIVDREYEYANLAQVGCITESDSAKLFGAGWVTAFPSAAEDGGFDIASAPATSIPATDMLGQPRTVGGGIDIGPYERQAEAGAPSIPQNLDGTPEGASDILLTWQPSTPAGGDAIAGYLIYLNRVLVDTVPAPDTSYTATELTSGDYAIQVAALSSAGKVSPKTPLGNVITLMEGAAYVVKIISVGAGVDITSPSNLTSTVSMGDSLTITFTLDGAYENPVVTANAAPVSCVLTDAGYVAVIKSTINVKVSIAASLKPTVTLTVDESIVIISPSGLSHTVETNSSFSIQFNLRQGYANPVVTVNGSNVDPTFSGGVYNVSITITENTTVSLSASPAPVTGIEDNVWDNDYVVATIYYNLLGQEVRTPAVSGIYFVKETYASKKTVVRKKLIIVR